MNLDQDIVNGFFFIATGTLGWFARQLWDAVKDLRKDLRDLRGTGTTTAGTYDLTWKITPLGILP